MKRNLVLSALFATCLCIKAQTGISTTHFVMDYYDPTSKQLRDTIGTVNVDFKDGKWYSIRIYPVISDNTVANAHVSFSKGNNGNFAPFIETLRRIKTCFEEWSQTAKDNHVTDFSKTMIDKKKKIFGYKLFLHFQKNGEWYSSKSDNGYPDTEFVPTFNVNHEGVPQFTLSGKEKYLGGWRYKQIEGYIPSVWSSVLTTATGKNRDYKAIGGRFAFDFSRPEQIQSLIDALDIDKCLKQLGEPTHTPEQRDSIDQLFK